MPSTSGEDDKSEQFARDRQRRGWDTGIQAGGQVARHAQIGGGRQEFFPECASPSRPLGRKGGRLRAGSSRGSVDNKYAARSGARWALIG